MRARSHLQLQLLGDLPASLADADTLAAKLRRDQEKLLAMVEYARWDGDRKQFLADYFLGRQAEKSTE